MSDKKIQFIVPEHEFRKIYSEGWTRPHNALLFATALVNAGHHDVEVLSGISNYLNHQEMLKRVEADIVGINTTIGTYRHALELSKEAKKKNPDARIVLGGPEATQLYKEILTNRGRNSEDYCVDLVVRGDGVRSFLDYVSGKRLEQISNLAWVDEQREIKTTEIVREDKSNWPIVDNGFINMERAFEDYRKKFGEVTPFQRASSIISQYGCSAKKWCKFCGRTDRRWFGRDPKEVWREIRGLVEDYGVDYIFDFTDSFLQMPGYAERFLEAKPADLNPAFRFFARADHITSESVRLLKEIGAYDVYIGFESGDQQMLDNMNKGVSVEQNLEAARLIVEQGLRLISSFVLGAPGETEQSLQNTVTHVEQISRISDLEGLLCSFWLPLPGSWGFRQIKDKFKGKDDLDLIELKKVWVRQMCNISYEMLETYVRRVLELTPTPIKDTKGVER